MQKFSKKVKIKINLQRNSKQTNPHCSSTKSNLKCSSLQNSKILDLLIKVSNLMNWKSEMIMKMILKAILKMKMKMKIRVGTILKD